MPYCRNCGTEIDAAARFCPACGTGTQVVQPAPVITQQVVYVKPKVPGRGLGISSMVVSIIGLVYSLSMLSATLELLEDSFWFDEAIAGVIVAMLMFASLSIMAIPFSLASRKRGYVNGISMSGLVMGILGTLLWVIQVGALIVGSFYYA